MFVVNDAVTELTNNEHRSRKLREYPLSAKLVFRTLERNGTMTINDIEKQTYLPHRTVRYAIKRLKEGGMVTQLFYIKDARQALPASRIASRIARRPREQIPQETHAEFGIAPSTVGRWWKTRRTHFLSLPRQSALSIFQAFCSRAATRSPIGP
ncbi:MAG: helix-turn-helix domain-containing protein [Halobacteriota archaeon]